MVTPFFSTPQSPLLPSTTRFAGYFNGKWFQGRWPPHLALSKDKGISIEWQELCLFYLVTPFCWEMPTILVWQWVGGHYHQSRSFQSPSHYGPSQIPYPYCHETQLSLKGMPSSWGIKQHCWCCPDFRRYVSGQPPPWPIRTLAPSRLP